MLKRRASLLLLACTPGALAQEIVRYDVMWNDNGNLNGNNNGVLEPGEAARIWFNVSFSPAVGTTTTYTAPPPPGVGTIAGLAEAEFDLIASANAGGGWALSGPGFNGVTGPNWGRRAGWVMGDVGNPGLPTGSLFHCATGNFLLPGSTANPLNPVDEIWRGKWTPTSFSQRTVTFTATDPQAHGTAGYSTLFVQYGTEPGTGHPSYITKLVGRQYDTIQIPIVPSPAAAAPLLLMLVARRSRR